MKAVCFGIIGVLAGGCAAHQPQAMPVVNTPAPVVVACAALAFDPPLAIGERELDLSRSTRGEAAFVGFEYPQTTVYNIQTDDRQSTDHTEFFTREAYIDRLGSIRR